MAHASFGHIKIVILCPGWEATDLEWAMTCTKEGNHEDVVQNCVTPGTWAAIDSDLAVFAHIIAINPIERIFLMCFASGDAFPGIHQGLSYDSSSRDYSPRNRGHQVLACTPHLVFGFIRYFLYMHTMSQNTQCRVESLITNSIMLV